MIMSLFGVAAFWILFISDYGSFAGSSWLWVVIITFLLDHIFVDVILGLFMSLWS